MNRLRGLAACTSLAAAGLALAGPAAAAPARTPGRAPGPSLTITEDDGHDLARPGMRLTSVVRVRNTGQQAVPNLRVTATVPPGTRFVEASAGGRFSAGQVVWKNVAVRPGATATVRAVTTVGDVPAAVNRLALVACASVGSATQPLVCAADLDRLPGRPDGSAKVVTAARAGHSVSWLRWLGLSAGALVAVALLAFGRARAAGRRRPSPAP